MIVNGSLFTYSEEHRLVAFGTEKLKHGCLIFIPGLTDGLLALGYLEDLISTLKGLSISFVQPVLRSSYYQYGISSLQTDCEDIEALLLYLEKEFNYSQYFLMGHSTGCQDIVYFLKNSELAKKVKISSCILQGAVSDREYMMQDPNTQKYLDYIKDHELKPTDLLPREADAAPITVHRYTSLAGRLTEDDLFSTDLTDTEMETLFQPLTTPILFLYSGNDQYVPETVNKYKYVHRVENAMPNCTSYLIGGADHEVSQPTARRIFIQIIFNYLSNLLKKQVL